MIDLSSDLTFLARIKKLPVVNSLPNTNLNPRFNLKQTEEQGKIHWYEGKCQKKLCTPQILINGPVGTKYYQGNALVIENVKIYFI